MNDPRRLVPLFTGLCVLLAGMTSAPAQVADVRAEITAANARFCEALRRGDVSGMTAFYSKNVQLFPAHSDILSSKQAIEQFWRESIKAGIRGGALRTLEVEVNGNTAWETGEYTMTGEGGKVFDKGKYLVVWKKEQGQWKLHRDIWNTNLAPVSDMPSL